jgi:large subunit ribosomal protein L10
LDRTQKAAVIDEIAADIDASEAVYAVDYRGITVPQAAEIRTKLREADTTFRVVKNSLTERAADKAGAEALKAYLEGPTALVFVRGDVAAAAKTINDFSRATELAPFKGGLLNGEVLDIEQIKSIARLPDRQALYGQLVGMVASPITGLARGLNALLSGVAIALGQVQAKAEAGEITLGGGAGEPAPVAAEPEAAADEAPAEPADETAAEAPAESAEEPVIDEPTDTETDQDAEAPEPAAASEEPAEGADDATATSSETETTQEDSE